MFLPDQHTPPVVAFYPGNFNNHDAIPRGFLHPSDFVHRLNNSTSSPTPSPAPVNLPHCDFYCAQLEALCDSQNHSQYPDMQTCLDTCSGMHPGGSSDSYLRADTLSCRMLHLFDLQFAGTSHSDPQGACKDAGPASEACSEPVAAPTPAPTALQVPPMHTSVPSPAPTPEIQMVACSPVQCHLSSVSHEGGIFNLGLVATVCQYDDIQSRVPGALSRCCISIERVLNDPCAISIYTFTYGKDSGHPTSEILGTLVSFVLGICQSPPAQSICLPSPFNGMMDGPEACVDCLPEGYDPQLDPAFGALYGEYLSLGAQIPTCGEPTCT